MIVIRRIETGSTEYAAARRLREAVLRAPLGLAWTEADLADETISHHFAALDGEEVVATLMLKPREAGVLQMRQVAVDPPQQGRGIGAQLVTFAEAFARDRGARMLMAHARGTALPFYRALGYDEEGEDFIENTIPHRLVTKQL